MPRFARLPDVIDGGAVNLARERESEIPELSAAIEESLDHLRPWMPWATPEGASVEAQTVRFRDAQARWRAGTDFMYLLRPAPGQGPLLGAIGLHRRIGPRAIEIGYWTHVSHTGNGYMTAAAKAATAAAAALRDVDRIEIHTDEANARSASIPERLGYRLDRVDARPPQAPAETGRLQIWVLDTARAGGRRRRAFRDRPVRDDDKSV